MFNNHAFFDPEKEAKCKIFRPWDTSDNPSLITPKKTSDDCGQDSTVSTTTKNDESEDSEEAQPSKPEKITEPEPAPQKPISPKRLKKKAPVKPPEPPENFPSVSDFPEFPAEGFPAFPDYYHASLAHSLGLTPTDPLFLEYLNQGCSLEEYQRVLNQEHQAKVLSSRKQRPKKYRCPHCDVGFSNNGQLKGHIRIHTGERPFRCDESNCGKTFTRNEELTRHKRIHSGLRPFPCTHCGKRFGRKDHLKKHSRTHFQPRGLYALPVMLPFETWASAASYPYVPMFTY